MRHLSNPDRALGQYLGNGEWINSYKDTFMYDGESQMTENLGLAWTDGEWINSSRYTYTYDDQGNLTEQLNHYLNGGWNISGRSLYTYDFKTYIAENNSDMPAGVILSPNYPNPFNLSTTIRFSHPEAGFADIVIFNVMGQKVRELLSKHMAPGIHSIVWDGCDDRGIPVTAGIYFSRLQMNNSSVSGRMMLVK